MDASWTINIGLQTYAVTLTGDVLKCDNYKYKSARDLPFVQPSELIISIAQLIGLLYPAILALSTLADGITPASILSGILGAIMILGPMWKMWMWFGAHRAIGAINYAHLNAKIHINKMHLTCAQAALHTFIQQLWDAGLTQSAIELNEQVDRLDRVSPTFSHAYTVLAKQSMAAAKDARREYAKQVIKHNCKET